MLSKTKLALAVVTLSVGATAPAFAGWSGNVGYTTNYVVRGINFGESGAYGGVDFSAGPFYAGTWVIDDGNNATDGLETDFYFGVAGGDDFFTWDVGVVRYEYTYTTTAETELSGSIGIGPFGLAVAAGNDDDGTVDSDYTYYELSLSGDHLSIKYGETDLDDDALFMAGAGFFFPDTKYIEVGIAGEFSGLDWSLNVGEPIDEPVYIGDQDAYMFLDISKSFDL